MKRVYNPDFLGNITAEEYLAQDPLGVQRAATLPILEQIAQEEQPEEPVQEEIPQVIPARVPSAAPSKAAQPTTSNFPSLAANAPIEGIKVAQADNEAAYAEALKAARDMEARANLDKAANALLAAPGLYHGAKIDMTPYNELADSRTKLAMGKAQDIQSKEKFGQDVISGKSAKNKFEQTQKEQDPNSDTSKSFRKAIERLSPELVKSYGADWEKVTAADKNDIWDIIKTKEQMDLRAQMAKDAAQARRDLEAEKRAAKKENEPMAAGIKKLDQEFAKDYNDWTSGGQASFDKNLQRLKDAKARLIETGAGGRFAGQLPDWLASEDMKVIRDDVHAAAVAGLRAALGAQFTEKEGERIQGYSFNQKLSPEENAKKIDAAIKELEEARANKEAKARQFEQLGTLKGYKAESVVTKTPSPNEETRLTKDGRRAIFDKDTKKFIRWAD